MSAFLNAIFRPIGEFLASPLKRRILLIGIIALAALIEFFSLGLARRTFVFYTISDKGIVVEDRMLKHTGSKESDIIRYTEEVLLGPAAPDLLPLFPHETKLKSLLYRNGVVFVDFSQEAAVPPVEGGETLMNFRTFQTGIQRNFSYVKDVRIFIEGRTIFDEKHLRGDFFGGFTGI